MDTGQKQAPNPPPPPPQKHSLVIAGGLFHHDTTACMGMIGIRPPKAKSRTADCRLGSYKKHLDRGASQWDMDHRRRSAGIAVRDLESRAYPGSVIQDRTVS